MFGPGVEEAIRNYIAAKDDREALAAMLMFGNTPKIIARFTHDETHAVGYDEQGREAIRVPFTEQFVVRRHYDERFQAFRLNTA
jgi:nitrate reductase / nitrite oxidoreductase, beta subunit